MWVTPKTNRPSFCLILKLSHALYHGLFSVLSRLHDCKHKFGFCWMKDHWTWLLLDIVAWDSLWRMEPTRYLFSGVDAVMVTGKYIFLQLQTCSASCTEDSCSPNIPSIFNNFLVFNFPLFNFEQTTFSLVKYSLLAHFIN